MPVTTELECRLVERLQVTDIVTVDGTKRGAPVNISGWGLKAVIHKVGNYTDPPLLTYSTAGGAITIPTGTDGILIFTVPLADVQTLGVGDFEWYVSRVDPGSEADLTTGAFSILPP